MPGQTGCSWNGSSSFGNASTICIVSQLTFMVRRHISRKYVELFKGDETGVGVPQPYRAHT